MQEKRQGIAANIRCLYSAEVCSVRLLANRVALAAAAVRVIEDETLAARLSAQGRAKCEAEFTWDVVTQQWIDTYRELAKR